MAKPPGNTAKASSIASWTIRFGALVPIAIAIWLAAKQASPDRPSISRANQSKTTAPLSSNNRHATDSSSVPNRQNAARLAALPSQIRTYLDTFDDEEAAALLIESAELLGESDIIALIDWYNADQGSPKATRALDLLAHLSTAEAIEIAQKIVQSPDRTTDDPVLLACAKSLVANADKQGLATIIARLNEFEQSGKLPYPTEVAALARIFASVANPPMERFIGLAAEGQWEATSTVSRAASIDALRSYPSYNTTAILARIIADDPEEKLRERANQVLLAIRSGSEP